MQQLGELLDEGKTPRDATRAEEGGAGVTAVGEGVVFEEGIEEGSHDLDGDFVLFHGAFAELVSSLNKRKLHVQYVISNSRVKLDIHVHVVMKINLISLPLPPLLPTYLNLDIHPLPSVSIIHAQEANLVNDPLQMDDHVLLFLAEQSVEPQKLGYAEK